MLKVDQLILKRNMVNIMNNKIYGCHCAFTDHTHFVQIHLSVVG